MKIFNRILEGLLWGLIFFIPFSTAGVVICLYLAVFVWVIKRVTLGVGEYKIATSKKLKKFFLCFRLSPNILNRPIYVLAIIHLVSCLLNSDVRLELQDVLGKLYSYLFVFFLVLEVIFQYNPNSLDQVKIRKRVLNRILGVFLFSITLIVLDGWFQYITGRDFLRGYLNTGRLQASFKSSNDFAAWIIIILPVLVFSSSVKFKRISQRLIRIIKIFCFILAISAIALLGNTFSRGAWIGSLISLGFVGISGFMYREKRLRLFVILGSILISSLVVLGVSSIKPIRERLSTLQKGVDIDGVRKLLWEEAFMIIKDYPILGTGPNTYLSVVPQYKIADKNYLYYPHNSFLHMAAEVGLLGLWAFLWVMWRFFRQGIKISKKQGNILLLGLMAGVLAFLIHSFFDTNLYSLQLVVLFWFVLGLGVSMFSLDSRGNS